MVIFAWQLATGRGLETIVTVSGRIAAFFGLDDRSAAFEGDRAQLLVPAELAFCNDRNKIRDAAKITDFRSHVRGLELVILTFESNAYAAPALETSAAMARNTPSSTCPRIVAEVFDEDWKAKIMPNERQTLRQTGRPVWHMDCKKHSAD